ncbi:hypothetical protein D3C75_914110 [compost metagenome]
MLFCAGSLERLVLVEKGVLDWGEQEELTLQVSVQVFAQHLIALTRLPSDLLALTLVVLLNLQNLLLVAGLKLIEGFCLLGG